MPTRICGVVEEDIHSLLHYILGVCTNCEAEIYGSVVEQVIHFIGRLIQSVEWRRLYTFVEEVIHAVQEVITLL